MKIKLLAKFTAGIFWIILFTIILTHLRPTYAAIDGKVDPSQVFENTRSVKLIFTGLNPNKTYEILDSVQVIDEEGFNEVRDFDGTYTTPLVCGEDDNELQTNCGEGSGFHATSYGYCIREKESNDNETCFSFEVHHFLPDVRLLPASPTPNDEIEIIIDGRRPGDDRQNNYHIQMESTDDGDYDQEHCVVSPGSKKFGPLDPGSYIAKIEEQVDENNVFDGCSGGYRYSSIEFTVDVNGGIVDEPVQDPDGTDPIDSEGGPPTEGRNPCDQNNDGIADTCKTALGEISTDIGAFASQFLSIAIGLAGGIALIILVIGSIRVLTSSGDQQRLGGGRDMIVAAIAGLLFLIFSTLILRFIGVSILGGIV